MSIFGLICFLDPCIIDKQKIVQNLTNIKVTIQCDLLSGLKSKSASHCLQDDVIARTMFDDLKVYQRLNLSSKDYFKQFKTVAFEKVILHIFLDSAS
jgi:hypothetical protein